MKLIIDITDRTVIRDILTHNLEATSETDKVIIEALYNGTPVSTEYEIKAINRGKCMLCGKELTEGLFFCKECEEKGEKQ